MARAQVRRRTPVRQGAPRAKGKTPARNRDRQGIGNTLRNAGGHIAKEAFPRIFGRGKKGVMGRPPIEKTYFPNPKKVNLAKARALADFELDQSRLRSSRYWHLSENPELLALRQEILELLKGGQIKSPQELNAAVEQLIKEKIESGALDQIKGMQMKVNIENNIENFRLFTRDEKVKLKQFFGKFHPGANISRIDVNPGEIGSNVNQVQKKAA
ncbi:MAG: hypothetical protein ABID38_05700 [Candidatus Diapherotrites archaeon]